MKKWRRGSTHGVILHVVVALVSVALFAAACGADEEAAAPAPAPPPPAPAPAPPPPAPAPAPPAPAPVPAMELGVMADPGFKQGGIFRIATAANPSHYDLHQSATVNNLIPQGSMYDNVIRFDPRDGGRTIIPDLAFKWEVSGDGLAQTFHLRDGVKFHDGAPFTADDVVATYNKIIFPAEGIQSIRKAIFEAVKNVEAVDPLTVRFEFEKPSPIFVPALGIGFNVIVRKATLEENDTDLRLIEDYPGTGPFRFVSTTPGEGWTVEKNPDYWIEGLPYLDGIEFMHMGGAARGAAVLTGTVDYSRPAATETVERAATTEGLTADRYISFSVLTWLLNNQREPWSDVRVRQALHLAFDRLAVNKTIAQLNRWDIGYWLRTDGAWGPSIKEVEAMVGYRPPTAEDLAKAKQLMAEAGYADGIKGVDFLCRGGKSVDFVCPAIQDMMKRNLNIESTIRPAEGSVWFDDSARGNFDWSKGASTSALDDPSDPWSNWFTTEGAQNFGRYSNPEFDRLVTEINTTADPAKRRALVKQGSEILDRDMPALLHAWETWSDVYWDYVKGANRDRVGIYTVGRWDTTWLDK